MSEPLSDVRLEQIRRQLKYAPGAAHELLAEVVRLRTPRGLTEEDRKALCRVRKMLSQEESPAHLEPWKCLLTILDIVARQGAEIEFRDCLIHDLKEESRAYQLGLAASREACVQGLVLLATDQEEQAKQGWPDLRQERLAAAETLRAAATHLRLCVSEEATPLPHS
jgi:hypothetical protein